MSQNPQDQPLPLNGAIRHILVPVDFSPAARSATEYAARLARTLLARVELLHVWAPADDTCVERLALRRFERTESGRAMKEFLAILEQAHVPAHGRVMIGDTCTAILDVAAEADHDLIVLGTHGRGSYSSLQLGGVSESLVRRAPIPVLTVRAERGSMKRAFGRWEQDAVTVGGENGATH